MSVDVVKCPGSLMISGKVPKKNKKQNTSNREQFFILVK